MLFEKVKRRDSSITFSRGKRKTLLKEVSVRTVKMSCLLKKVE